MKKWMYIVLLVAVVIGASACQKNNADDSGKQETPPVVEEQQPSVEEQPKSPGKTEQQTPSSQGETSQNETSQNETSQNETPQNEEMPEVPDFTLEASNGENVSLSDYRGKVVVLNFWASWCPPCDSEMPEFQKLHEELEGSDEVVLLMLNQTDGQRETKEKANTYVTDRGYSFLTLYDQGQVGSSIFGLSSIPVTVAIDKEGRLSNYILGPADYDTLLKLIEEAK